MSIRPAVDPLKGEIKGNGRETITITFCPSTHSTAVCELMLHLSEFEFVPLPCRISGSGAPRPPKSPQALERTLQKDSKILGPGRTQRPVPPLSQSKIQAQAQALTSTQGQGMGDMPGPQTPLDASKAGKTLLSMKKTGKAYLIVIQGGH